MNSIRNVIYYILCTLIFISACDSKMKEQPSELQKNGTETVFIKKILFNDNDVFLIADSIQFLTGEDAAKAYFEDKGKEIDEKKIDEKEINEKWLLDMVALATVADMVPLLGENRTLLKYGLTVLKKTKKNLSGVVCLHTANY